MKPKAPQNKFIYIFGKNPIEEILMKKPNLVMRVYAKEGIPEFELSVLLPYLKKNKIPFVKVPERKLEQLAPGVSHQGFVAEIREYPLSDMYEVLEKVDMNANPAFLVLDEIQDPHNYGAIIRSAAAAGVSGIIVAKNNQASITGTVFKTSAGALASIPIIEVSNIATTLLQLKEKGFWVAGLAMEGSTSYWDQELTGPMVFVVGNEGHGLRDLTKKRCDYILSIPMKEGVESLNASVSAALLLYEWKRQIGA